jgi:hypothetical protein
VSDLPACVSMWQYIVAPWLSVSAWCDRMAGNEEDQRPPTNIVGLLTHETLLRWNEELVEQGFPLASLPL